MRGAVRGKTSRRTPVRFALRNSKCPALQGIPGRYRDGATPSDGGDGHRQIFAGRGLSVSVSLDDRSTRLTYQSETIEWSGTPLGISLSVAEVDAFAPIASCQMAWPRRRGGRRVSQALHWIKSSLAMSQQFRMGVVRARRLKGRSPLNCEPATSHQRPSADFRRQGLCTRLRLVAVSRSRQLSGC